MQQQLKILAICSIVYHALQAIIVLIIVPIFLSASIMADDATTAGILSLVGTIITITILVLTIPGIIGGIGLLKGKRWSRILLMIANAISLLSFPIGTALGIFTFIILTKDEAEEMLVG